MSTDEQRHLQHESSSSTADSLSSVSDVERDGIIRKSRGSPECELNYVRPSLWAQKCEIVTLIIFN